MSDLESSKEGEHVRGFKVGSQASFRHVITMEDVRRFAEITGDNNPIHLDPEFAEKTSFRGIIAHGMLGASFFSTLIGKHIPGDGALWLSQSLDFLSPVRIGDTLTVCAEVTAISVSQQVLTLKMEITNQHGQKVVQGTSKAKALPIESGTRPTEKPEHEKHVVIITGASRGIGAASALALAKQGHAIVINYHSDENGAIRTARDIETAGGQAICVGGDVSEPTAAKRIVHSALDRFGYLSAIVHNATPRLIYKPFQESTNEDFEKNFGVIFYGAYHLLKESIPHLEASGRGSFVTIGTVATDAPAPQLTAYTCAKSALEMLTKSLAVEYGPKGIRFNIISPGMTETSLIADTAERAKMVVKMQTPLRRLATPQDIAAGVAFLLGDEARHITGENLRICGGVVMR